MHIRRKPTPYRLFYNSAADNEQAALDRFFSETAENIMLLPKRQRTAILEDFEKAFVYYGKNGISAEDAIKRLSYASPGDFYSQTPTDWYPLDYAAKIYPMSMNSRWMAVFRLSVYFNADIVPELLQIALIGTIKRFPFFATSIKKGFFWHYIDSARHRFISEPESKRPCAPLNISTSSSQLFRVVYYKERLSVEYFHILTDGTGGMIFLKTLAAEYLRLLGVNIPAGGGLLNVNDEPTESESENAFEKVASADSSAGFAAKNAVQLRGRISRVVPARIIHFEMDSSRLVETAKERNCTVTALILSFMLEASKAASEESKGSIQIQVPVNMRKYYRSDTIRNFTMYGYISVPRSEVGTADTLLPEVTRQLAQITSEENMRRMVTATKNLVKYLKFIPLFIKQPIAAIIYSKLADDVFTSTISNLGVVVIPDEMKPYVKKLDFVLGTGVKMRATCSMVTAGSVTTLSIAKQTYDRSFETQMRRLLIEHGLEPVLSGSEEYGIKDNISPSRRAVEYLAGGAKNHFVSAIGFFVNKRRRKRIDRG
ncbi:MAG: hypothetical protein GXY20_02470 [Clostridiales bacterium]|nr:hypothetical protein [Clostridiales bacterium]